MKFTTDWLNQSWNTLKYSGNIPSAEQVEELCDQFWNSRLQRCHPCRQRGSGWTHWSSHIFVNVEFACMCVKQSSLFTCKYIHVYNCVNVCMDWWIDGCVDVWMYGCMDGWGDWLMDGWMEGWMGGCISRCKCTYQNIHAYSYTCTRVFKIKCIQLYVYISMNDICYMIYMCVCM